MKYGKKNLLLLTNAVLILGNCLTQVNNIPV
jgi:MFS family permease